MIVTAGLAASVQARLVQHAKGTGVDPNHVLVRFAAERFLYRLSRSVYAERFVLKGALLMLVWLGESIRSTRDADLLGFDDLSEAAIAQIFADVCNTDVEPDGMHYLGSTIRVAPIRPEDVYGGWRATLQARLGNARLPVQVDIGIGDAVTPAPEWLDYPGLLDLPRARLRAYRPETAIAEKLHAMVVLGEANSRIKDFFDIHALSRHRRFDLDILTQAVRATFARRNTPLPSGLPFALTGAFATLPGKQAQWRSFLQKNGIRSQSVELEEIIGRLAGFLGPVLAATRTNEQPNMVWLPGGPWGAKHNVAAQNEVAG